MALEAHGFLRFPACSKVATKILPAVATKILPEKSGRQGLAFAFCRHQRELVPYNKELCIMCGCFVYNERVEATASSRKERGPEDPAERKAEQAEMPPTYSQAQKTSVLMMDDNDDDHVVDDDDHDDGIGGNTSI